MVPGTHDWKITSELLSKALRIREKRGFAYSMGMGGANAMRHIACQCMCHELHHVFFLSHGHADAGRLIQWPSSGVPTVAVAIK